MNVTSLLISVYENLSDWTLGENKPNSNPIKPNLKRAKMNANSPITKNYRKNDDFVVRINKPNSNPISKRPKMSANVYFIEDYENETAFRHKKTNPNKPNSNPALSVVEWANFKRPFFRKDIYWLPEHILSRNSSLSGYSLRSLNREYMASRVL